MYWHASDYLDIDKIFDIEKHIKHIVSKRNKSLKLKQNDPNLLSLIDKSWEKVIYGNEYSEKNSQKKKKVTPISEPKMKVFYSDFLSNYFDCLIWCDIIEKIGD